MAQQQSEIRYLTPPSVDVKKKKYCRFKKSGIKYIDYKDPEFLKKFLNEQGKILPRRITGTSLKFQRRVAQAVKNLIMNEVNVKEVRFVDGAAGVLVKKVKCDFKKLGPKFGKQMKAVAAAVAEMSQEAIGELEKNGKYTLNLDGAEAVIEASDVEIFDSAAPAAAPPEAFSPPGRSRK